MNKLTFISTLTIAIISLSGCSDAMMPYHDNFSCNGLGRCGSVYQNYFASEKETANQIAAQKSAKTKKKKKCKKRLEEQKKYSELNQLLYYQHLENETLREKIGVLNEQ